MDIPASYKVPPGVIPNFDHPQSRVIDLRVGFPLCLGIALVFVILRLYVKLAITRMWGCDDCELERKVIPSKLTAIGACLIGFVRYNLNLMH